MKNFFFYKLYLFDKRLFVFILIFSGLTILCNIKGDEITPFFIWAMYSEKEDVTNKYQIFKILANDSLLVNYSAGYSDNNRFYLGSPLGYYNRIKQNSSIDPALSFLKEKWGSNYKTIQPLVEKLTNSKFEQDLFTNWYRRYLEQSLGKTIYSLKVQVLRVHFKEDYQLQTDSSYLLAAWNQQ